MNIIYKILLISMVTPTYYSYNTQLFHEENIKFHSNTKNNSQKIEIFIDMLQITSNALLVIYLIIKVHFCKLIPQVIGDEKYFNYYNNLNLITILFILNLFSYIILFIYELTDFYKAVTIITYISSMLIFILLYFNMANTKHLSDKLKENINFQSLAVLSVNILNIILIVCKNYIKQKEKAPSKESAFIL